MNIKVTSHSPDDTFKIGENLGKQLKGNEIILLHGELGAGKTLFTKGIAAAAGIDPKDVVSPTFTLINQYPGQHHFKFFHFDLYRLGPHVSHLPEIDDYLDEGLMVIEWAQYLNPAYYDMKQVIQVYFYLSEEDDQSRILEIVSLTGDISLSF
jgi:tRNA threonylcarbamoyladenosine biosynthesis protein TsaE